MSLGFCFGSIESGTLQNYINTDLAPRKISSIFLSINFDSLAINSDGILASLYSVQILADFSSVSALSGIIF